MVFSAPPCVLLWNEGLEQTTGESCFAGSLLGHMRFVCNGSTCSAHRLVESGACVYGRIDSLPQKLEDLSGSAPLFVAEASCLRRVYSPEGSGVLVWLPCAILSSILKQHLGWLEMLLP